MAITAQPISPAHGTDVFDTHSNCSCKKCAARRKAVNQLVESFSQIPSRWIEVLSEHQGEWLPLPMWGTVFVPKDSADMRSIEKLMRKIKTENEDHESMRDAGWQEVADTGIYAVWFDDELLLGIHGAGYDFYSHHWEKLYDTLGYHWHE